MITTFVCGHSEPRDNIVDVRVPGLCPSCIAARDRFHTNAARMRTLVSESRHVELQQFIKQEYGPFVQYGPRQKFRKTMDPARARWLKRHRKNRKKHRGHGMYLRSGCRLPAVWPKVREALDRFQETLQWLHDHPEASETHINVALGSLEQARSEGLAPLWLANITPQTRDRIAEKFSGP